MSLGAKVRTRNARNAHLLHVNLILGQDREQCVFGLRAVGAVVLGAAQAAQAISALHLMGPIAMLALIFSSVLQE